MCEDLELDSLDVVHAGAKTFPMTDDIRALSIDDLPDGIGALSPPPVEPD